MREGGEVMYERRKGKEKDFKRGNGGAGVELGREQ